MKEILKGSAIIFAFKIIGAASLFLINILISNHYGPEYLGIFNLLFALLQVSSIFSRAGLDMYIVKIIPTISDSNILSSFLKKIFLRVIILSLLISLVVFLGKDLLDQYIFKNIEAQSLLQMLVFCIIPYTFFTIIPEILRGFQEVILYSFLKNGILYILILLFLGIIIKIGYDNPAYALYFGVFVAFFISCLIIILFLQRKYLIRNRGTYGHIDPILRESYPMLLTVSMVFLMSNVDSFMIGFYKNEYEVGLYNACVRLSFMITFVLTSVNGYVSPKISKYFHDKDFDGLKDIYVKSVKIIWVVVFPIVLLLYVFPDFFLSLFGEEFLGAKSTLLILNTAYLANAVFGPVGHMLNMTKYHRLTMYIISFGLAINIIGNLILIPAFGIEGAAYATLLSSLFWNIGCYYVVRKKILI